MLRTPSLPRTVAALVAALGLLHPAGCGPDLSRARFSPSEAVAAARSELVGAVVDVQGLPVLRLAGSPREMGFAHGRALAAGIKEGFEEFVLRYRCHGIRARYEQIAKRVANEIGLPPRFRAELEGMLEGMEASGVDLALPMLRRSMKLIDLEVLNSIDHWGLFGCSGFTAWGRSTEGGDVLCARNFDFDLDPERKAIARLGVVVTFEPDEGRRLVSFGFPGLVGTVSGLSEAGVGAFLHVGNGGFGGGEEGRSLPPSILARMVLEECSPAQAAARAEELIATACFRNSYLLRIVTPGVDAPPTTVFEVDPRGFERQRLPDEAKGEPPLLVTTNHYLTRAAPFAVIPDSRIRYCNLEDDARRCLADGDRRIAPEEAWNGLGLVKQEQGIVTLHSLVWRPRTQELWAAFGDVDPQRGRARSATRRVPAVVRLADLFGD